MFLMPMSAIGFGAHYGATGYTITNALMLDATADSLTKTFSGSGNRNTYTRSFWIKRSKLGAQMKIFDTGPDGGNNLEALYFSSSDTLYWTINDSNAVRYNYQTTQVFRDTTAWYHFVCARDTATVKMYVNGDEITSFATSTNAGTSNIGRWTHTDQNVIGKYFLNASDFLGGYLAEIIQVDGSILTPTSFGERDSNGVWVPIEPPASLGTNGFHLDFESTDIGNDAAGSNNWTAGAGSGPNNVVVDSSTDDSSTEVTLYPALDGVNTTYQQGTLSNNNKTMTVSSGNWSGYRINMPVTSGGKIYFEFVIAGNSGQGAGLTTIVGNIDQPGAGSPYVGKTGNYSMQRESGFWTPSNAVNVPTGHETGSDSSYYKCAYDDSNGKLWFGDADGWYGSSVSDSDVANGDDNTYTVAADDRGGKLFIYCSGYTNGGNTTLRLLSTEWSSSAPSGFNALTKTVTGVGNYWTLNPLASTDTLTNGNLSYTGAANFSSYVTAPALPMTGKWYWEIKAVGAAAISASANYDTYVGVVKTSVAIPTASHTSDSNLWVWGNPNPASDSGSPAGTKYNGSGTSLPPTSGFGDNSIIMIAVDMDNNSIWFGNDGTWAGSGTPAGNSNAAFSNLSGQVMPFQSLYSDSATYNFGATAFAHTPPTGFKALNTANLPAPTVTKPSDHFKAIIYEGTGAELSTGDTDVEALSFKPDFVWIKNRDTSDHHMLYDSVREATKDLHPSIEHAETTTAQTLKSFDANGFTLGTDDQVNTNNESYVAWCLKAGGAPTTDNDNTSGAMDDGAVFKSGVVQSSYTPSGSPSNYPKKMSIASHGGFSIVEYVGTGANATVPHGLSRTPTFFMLKPMTQAHGWAGYHSAIGTGSGNDKVIRWDTTTIGDQLGDAWQNNPFANAHTITFGSQTGQNEDTIPHIMYVWAKTPGLIGIGSYTANGSDNGPYVVVDDGASGFRPAWVMTKRIDHSSGDWWITDSVRTTSNPMSKAIYIDAQPEEDADDNRIDFLSNGFKLRDDSSRRNTVVSGSNNFIYLAFAEDPFGGSGVAQARAR